MINIKSFLVNVVFAVFKVEKNVAVTDRAGIVHDTNKQQYDPRKDNIYSAEMALALGPA